MNDMDDRRSQMANDMTAGSILNTIYAYRLLGDAYIDDSRTYDDTSEFQWRNINDSDIANFRNYQPADLFAITDQSNFGNDADSVDTLLGFSDGTYWRIPGWSAFDLLRDTFAPLLEPVLA